MTSRLNVGGLAKLVLSACDGLERRGFQCALVTGRVGPGEGNLVELEGLRSAAIDIAELGRAPEPSADLVALAKLTRWMRHFRPHIVHTHAAKAGALGRMAAAITGVPVRIHSFHGHVFEGYFSSPVSRVIVAIERQLSRLTSAIAVPGESQRLDIGGRYRIAPLPKVRVVPYGIDVAFFATRSDAAACRGRFKLPQAARVIGMIGRLAPIKNHGLLLDAFDLLSRRPEFSDVHLLVVGGGECRAQIDKKVDSLVAADRVRVCGWVPDLREAYGAIDVLAVTSKNEGMPIAAMEAMAAGVPVVATAVGGVVDLITDGETGLLVRTANAADIAFALERLLVDVALRRHLIEAAHQWIEARHNTEAHVRSLDALYRECLAAGSARATGRRLYPTL